jgi:hypothetical protein
MRPSRGARPHRTCVSPTLTAPRMRRRPCPIRVVAAATPRPTPARSTPAPSIRAPRWTLHRRPAPRPPHHPARTRAATRIRASIAPRTTAARHVPRASRSAARRARCAATRSRGTETCPAGRLSQTASKARAPSASRGAPTDQDFWREMMRGGFSSFEHVARARPRARRRDDGRTLSLSSPLGPLAYALVIERYVRRLRQARASYLKSMLERGVRVRGLLGSRRAGARVRAA